MYSDYNNLKNEDFFNTNYKVKLVGFFMQDINSYYFFKSHEEIYVLNTNYIKEAYKIYNKINIDNFNEILQYAKGARDFQLLNLEVQINKEANIFFESNFLEIFIDDDLPFEMINLCNKFSKSGVFINYEGFKDYLFDKRTLNEIIDGYKNEEKNKKIIKKEIEKEERY